MNKYFKKQEIFGILGTLGSIALLVVTLVYAAPENKWALMILFAVFVGLIFGFLCFFFSGWKGFISGGAVGFGLVAFLWLNYALPRPYNSFLILGAILVFMVWPVIMEYRRNRAADRPEKGGKLVRELEKEAEQEKEILEVDTAFKAAIRFKEKSLLLQSATDTLYQIIREEDAYYFVRIGNELSGIKPELLKLDFSDESAYLGCKKDFKIPRSEIVSLKFKKGKAISTPMTNSGKLTMTMGTRKRRFIVLETVDAETLATFFEGLPLDVRGGWHTAESEKEEPLTHEVERSIGALKAAGLILNILAFIIPAAFLFLLLDYTLLSVLCMAVPAVSFVLYLKYGSVFMIDDDDKVFKKKRVNLGMPLILPSTVLGLRSITDINATGFKMFALWSVLFFACILGLFFRFTKQRKGKRKNAATAIVIAALFFAPAAVMQINYLFNTSTPVVTDSILYDKEITESTKSPDRYVLTVTLSNGKKAELQVSKDLYNSVEKGGTVQVYEYAGLLGIPYADVGAEITA